MPVVDVDPDELRHLTGHDEKDDEELKEDLFALGLEYEGETEDGLMQLEFAPDRLDRLSVEGVARSLRYQYGDDRGVYLPSTNDADWTIEVEESVPDERPYVTGAIVRGLDMDEAGLDSLIQLQEKLHATMGRKRAKGAIGVHDLTMLKGGPATGDGGGQKSIRYVGVEPDGDTFVPLDSNRELTPGEVLTEHPTGETYADLVADYERFPAIYDDVGLFSFPPVINGKRTEVEPDSRDLFIEMTGTDQWTIDKMLNIVCYALDARGGRVERVDVEYPDRTLDRPDLSVSHKSVSHQRIESLLGISLDPREVVDLMERAGLDATADVDDPEDIDPEELVYETEVPPYRVDVLHPLDLVDDVGRAYGFNDLEPRYPDVGTIGGRHERSRVEDAARDALVGLGFEDMLDFHMISEAENYERMGLDVPPVEGEGDVTPDPDAPVGARPPVTITEPYSEDYTMVRTWALPSLTMVLERNTHRAYPQDLAEIGLAAARDDEKNTRVSEHRTVAAVLARTDATYEDAKGKLQALCRAFDVDLETPPTQHPSFIDGRTASVVIDGEEVGVIGELHPRVLVEHDLELPVAGFEFRLSALR
ncbi:phenylalanine--tRNA ligase subunit beta [Haloglomus litoreum]|uniref:phenylalanine--tRNA ligase subunit beta n=1 Tax=Haloglomus litoreum TaxID=3034026 RepID=UPI0023E7772B|nr:phenylalanine--tRNA ligase subunit beta [Haloglomus sp. DT116]